MNEFSDKKIIDSWKKNSAPWTVAVRENQIESRVLITNQAIVDAVISVAPKNVLDIGCGEGWLARELCLRNMDVLGLDVVADLVEQARQSDIGEFRVMSYEQIAQGEVAGTFDAVVCNFSLLGKESVEGIFTVVPRLLNNNGHFIVQTIHPDIGCGEQAYEDGWRMGSWQGFSVEFTDSAPWYFRTMESWFKLFQENSLDVLEIREQIHPKTEKAVSLIMIGQVIS